MKLASRLRVCFAVLALLTFGVSAIAEEKSPITITITMSDLDCASCAKKVATKLSEVEGVAKVETDLDTQTAKVTLKPKASVSVKVLWEAVEKAKKTPTKIESPSGVVTAKPAS